MATDYVDAEAFVKVRRKGGERILLQTVQKSSSSLSIHHWKEARRLIRGARVFMMDAALKAC